ncbi:unnamed protein product [Bursaphelenchus okinawaensis]|uniref:Uncharacterized protein n=1 Tax=Bursaphelenchus okinawaensis TaxID=465554 RepID=A0A811KMA8_9BILA|nr:unnamed protein product [Bursaphelenchus okinawaensis]CAG9105933.1 unnamed protein product [Bursaphelenchus okinawaensis]
MSFFNNFSPTHFNVPPPPLFSRPPRKLLSGGATTSANAYLPYFIDDNGKLDNAECYKFFPYESNQGKTGGLRGHQEARYDGQETTFNATTGPSCYGPSRESYNGRSKELFSGVPRDSCVGPSRGLLAGPSRDSCAGPTRELFNGPSGAPYNNQSMSTILDDKNQHFMNIYFPYASLTTIYDGAGFDKEHVGCYGPKVTDHPSKSYNDFPRTSHGDSSCIGFKENIPRTDKRQICGVSNNLRFQNEAHGNRLAHFPFYKQHLQDNDNNNQYSENGAHKRRIDDTVTQNPLKGRRITFETLAGGSGTSTVKALPPPPGLTLPWKVPPPSISTVPSLLKLMPSSSYTVPPPSGFEKTLSKGISPLQRITSSSAEQEQTSIMSSKRTMARTKSKITSDLDKLFSDSRNAQPSSSATVSSPKDKVLPTKSPSCDEELLTASLKKLFPPPKAMLSSPGIEPTKDYSVDASCSTGVSSSDAGVTCRLKMMCFKGKSLSSQDLSQSKEDDQKKLVEGLLEFRIFRESEEELKKILRGDDECMSKCDGELDLCASKEDTYGKMILDLIEEETHGERSVGADTDIKDSEPSEVGLEALRLEEKQRYEKMMEQRRVINALNAGIRIHNINEYDQSITKEQMKNNETCHLKMNGQFIEDLQKKEEFKKRQSVIEGLRKAGEDNKEMIFDGDMEVPVVDGFPSVFSIYNNSENRKEQYDIDYNEPRGGLLDQATVDRIWGRPVERLAEIPECDDEYDVESYLSEYALDELYEKDAFVDDHFETYDSENNFMFQCLASNQPLFIQQASECEFYEEPECYEVYGKEQFSTGPQMIMNTIPDSYQRFRRLFEELPRKPEDYPKTADDFSKLDDQLRKIKSIENQFNSYNRPAELRHLERLKQIWYDLKQRMGREEWVKYQVAKSEEDGKLIDEIFEEFREILVASRYQMSTKDIVNQLESEAFKSFLDERNPYSAKRLLTSLFTQSRKRLEDEEMAENEKLKAEEEERRLMEKEVIDRLARIEEEAERLIEEQNKIDMELQTQEYIRFMNPGLEPALTPESASSFPDQIPNYMMDQTSRSMVDLTPESFGSLTDTATPLSEDLVWDENSRYDDVILPYGAVDGDYDSEGAPWGDFECNETPQWEINDDLDEMTSGSLDEQSSWVQNPVFAQNLTSQYLVIPPQIIPLHQNGMSSLHLSSTQGVYPEHSLPSTQNFIHLQNLPSIQDSLYQKNLPAAGTVLHFGHQPQNLQRQDARITMVK